MTVKSLAVQAGVSPHTVRYYADRGLLAPTRGRRNGYREFSPRDLQVLRFVPRAKALGFALGEIRTIVEKSRRAESPCPIVRDIVHRRIEEFGDRLEELQATLGHMRRAAARARPGADRPGDLPPDRVPGG